MATKKTEETRMKEAMKRYEIAKRTIQPFVRPEEDAPVERGEWRPAEYLPLDRSDVRIISQ